MKLTAAYKKVGDWWAAWVEEIPGVNTQGATLEEARENLKDALRMVLEANRELSEKEQEATRREDLVRVRLSGYPSRPRRRPSSSSVGDRGGLPGWKKDA